MSSLLAHSLVLISKHTIVWQNNDKTKTFLISSKFVLILIWATSFSLPSFPLSHWMWSVRHTLGQGFGWNIQGCHSRWWFQRMQCQRVLMVNSRCVAICLSLQRSFSMSTLPKVAWSTFEMVVPSLQKTSETPYLHRVHLISITCISFLVEPTVLLRRHCPDQFLYTVWLYRCVSVPNYVSMPRLERLCHPI